MKYNDKIPFNLYLQVEAVPKTINDTIIALKIRVEDKEYRRDIRNHVWKELEKSLDEKSKFVRPKRFGNGRTMTIAEIRDFSTKGDLYNVIKEAYSKHNYLTNEVYKVSNFNFDVNLAPTIADDIILINSKVPDIKVGLG